MAESLSCGVSPSEAHQVLLRSEERSGPLSPAGLRIAGCVLLCLSPLALAWGPLRILTLVLENETFSQIPLIPFVSIFIVYLNRRTLFRNSAWGWHLGTALLIPGTIFLAVPLLNSQFLNSANRTILVIFGIVIFWIGAFALFFGPRAFWDARFPLLFLLFMVPIPESMLSKVILFLQKESAAAAELLFRLAGIPYLRQGFSFALPGVTIRVAEECSGIRSTLALLITTALVSHFMLKSNWKRALLCVAIVPISILKNGLRIVTLSTLAIYVNPDFLYGNLHRHGGVIFFLIGLVPLILTLVWFQKAERSTAQPLPEGRAFRKLALQRPGRP
jgi:exosortase